MRDVMDQNVRNKQFIEKYLSDVQSAILNISRDEIDEVIKILLGAFQNDYSIYVCGNGGSALTASHMACDFCKGASYGRDKKFKFISLVDNIGVVMAYANDVSYENIFVEQIRNILKPNEVVIGISGSGNSPNVLNAIEYANEVGATTIGLTGYDGGKLREISKYSINANINDMQISEDMHIEISKYSINANINDMQISEDMHMIVTHMLMRTICQHFDLCTCSQ